jgi:hypothetical protein
MQAAIKITDNTQTLEAVTYFLQATQFTKVELRKCCSTIILEVEATEEEMLDYIDDILWSKAIAYYHTHH